MTLPLTIDSGETATITVGFTPTAIGTRTGTLTVTSNAPTSPTLVSLTGTGVEEPPAPPALRLSTSGGDIVDSLGATVVLRGVNWHGAEGSNRVPHVLWQRSYASMIDQIAAMGFNCIRIPLAADMTAGTAASSVNTFVNPDLDGLSALGVLDKLIEYCGTKGLYVFLDCHRMTAGAGTDSLIGSGTIATITTFWQMLATRYGANPTVCGADLYNEPYLLTWNDLAGHYETLGAAIHAIAPDWLIICEGNGVEAGVSYWWGGQLAGAAARPVVFTQPNKLVYSPHDYGHSVAAQAWLKSTTNMGVAGWPANLDAIWDAAWGYLPKTNVAPIILGEYGGKFGYDGAGLADAGQVNSVFEREWLARLSGYLVANGMSSTFWTFTSQSSDTGGLLCDGDISVQTGKLTLLAEILA